MTQGIVWILQTVKIKVARLSAKGAGLTLFHR
jgi:hypothetical protein